MRVEVLSPSFSTPNSSSFVFPLLRHRRALVGAGVELRVRTEARVESLEADQVWVDSKALSSAFRAHFPGLAEALPELREAGHRIVFFDTQDSTGSLVTEVLPDVDAYYKAQLLCDLDRYGERHYGLRLHTDHYHRVAGIVDSEPVRSEPLPAPQRAKLGVSWNSGLTSFALGGFTARRLHSWLGWRPLLAHPRRFARPDSRRPHDLSCRMSYTYDRETVSFQRQRVRDLLGARCRDGRKLPRLLYLAELGRSKIVPSPFGWGEVNYRDFETMRAGALLLKPEMEHLRTYPDWYEAGVTYASHSWELDDVVGVVEEWLAAEQRRLEVAAEAQRRYRFHNLDAGGAARFVGRVLSIAEAASRGEALRE